MIKKSLKRSFWGFCILIASFAIFESPAQAEVFRGEVVAVKDNGSSLSFKRSDPSNPSLKEQFDIVMRPDTKFKNVSSLKELAPGDSVVVDAVQKPESKIWEARSVRIYKLRLYQTEAAQKAQPD